MTPDKFIKKMEMHFGLPRLEDQKLINDFYADYIFELEKFSDSTLEEAIRRLITRNDSKRFPRLAECLIVCHESEGDISPAKPRTSCHDKYPEWGDERVKFANKAINSDSGRRAVAEGWIIALHDFCREQHRWPNRWEAEKIKTQSLARQQSMRDAIGGGVNFMLKAMETRKENLSKIANGEKL